MKRIEKKDKRAISVMIGYILLISVAVVMAIIVYSWLKTYVPKESLDCPDGVSILIKDYTCDSNQLSITTLNNGRFNVAGYFVRVADNPDLELATIDLSKDLTPESAGKQFGNGILFAQGSGNSLQPSEEATNIFDISSLTTLYFVELAPLRFQEEEGRERLVSCANKKVKEEFTC